MQQRGYGGGGGLRQSQDQQAANLYYYCPQCDFPHQYLTQDYYGEGIALTDLSNAQEDDPDLPAWCYMCRVCEFPNGALPWWYAGQLIPMPVPEEVEEAIQANQATAGRRPQQQPIGQHNQVQTGAEKPLPQSSPPKIKLDQRAFAYNEARAKINKHFQEMHQSTNKQSQARANEVQLTKSVKELTQNLEQQFQGMHPQANTGGQDRPGTKLKSAFSQNQPVPQMRNAYGRDNLGTVATAFEHPQANETTLQGGAHYQATNQYANRPSPLNEYPQEDLYMNANENDQFGNVEEHQYDNGQFRLNVPPDSQHYSSQWDNATPQLTGSNFLQSNITPIYQSPGSGGPNNSINDSLANYGGGIYTEDSATNTNGYYSDDEVNEEASYANGRQYPGQQNYGQMQIYQQPPAQGQGYGYQVPNPSNPWAEQQQGVTHYTPAQLNPMVAPAAPYQPQANNQEWAIVPYQPQQQQNNNPNQPMQQQHNANNQKPNPPKGAPKKSPKGKRRRAKSI